MIDDDESYADPDKAAENPSEEDGEGFLLKAKAWLREDRDHLADWRDDAKVAFDFTAGNQWTEDEKQTLKDQLRPVITFNRMLPTIEAVVGIEVGNRREVKYYPRTQGDAQVNEILSAAADWARDECEAEDEETDAFFDTVVCGMGWTESRMDYEEDPEGKVIIERVSPFEMYPDGSARKRNLADARRMTRVRKMALNDAKAMWPGFDAGELNATWASDDSPEEPHNTDPRLAYTKEVESPGGKECEEVTIVHVQWWEREPFYRIADPFGGGRVADLSVEDHDKLQKRLEVIGTELKSAKMMRRVYKQAFLGSVVLEGPMDSECPDGFSWQCITGKRDQTKGTFFGLAKSMIDAQSWANKWLSQSMHILNSQAKGGILAEKGAFDNDREAEESYARSDRITWLKTGGAAKIQPKPQAQFPAGFENLMQFAISSIRDVSGVNLELLGLRDANQAGVLEEHRKQAGMTILAMMFDSLRRYRKRQGRVLLYYITNYLSDGRLIRIVGEEGAKYVPLLKQPGVVEYDVIVDDSPTSTNQREKTWNTIIQMMPFLGKSLSPQDIWTLAEYSPLPAAIVEKLQKAAKEQAAAQAPDVQLKKQMAIQTHQNEMEQGHAKAAKDTASAQKTTVEAKKEAMTPVQIQVPAVGPFGL